MPTDSCAGGVYRIESGTADKIRPRSGEVTFWSIDGAEANSRERFFPALASALHFPAYFGHNWDATYDCLTDLAGGDAKVAVLLISHGERFREGMAEEWETCHNVFTQAAEFWQAQGRLLVILLISDTALPGAPLLPLWYLAQVVSPMDADLEIAAADDEIRRLNRAGAFDDALHVAQALVTRFPDNARAQFVLAGTFDFQDREVDALAAYQQAWQLGLAGDDVPRFYVQYGSTLRNVGQFDESVRILREGRERFPENAAIQAFLSLALFSAGRPAESLATSLAILTDRAGTVDLQGYERALREYIAELNGTDSSS